MFNIFIICLIFILSFLLLKKIIEDKIIEDKIIKDKIIKDKNIEDNFMLKYCNNFIRYLIKIKPHTDLTNIIDYKKFLRDLEDYGNLGLIEDYHNFITFHNNFLTADECQYFINIDKNEYKSSKLYKLNECYNDNSIRSSHVIYFTRKHNKLIEQIENKIALLLNINILQIEPIQLVKYEKGQEYLHHYDFIQESNIRIKSFIIYLTTLTEKDGGATNYILYDEQIYPKQGMAVYFSNYDSYNRINILSLHSGEKILTNNIKYILVTWIRLNKY